MSDYTENALKVAKDLRYDGPLEEVNINAIELVMRYFKSIHPKHYWYYNQYVCLGVKQKDIASQMSCSVATVSKRVCEARTYLHTYFLSYNVVTGYSDKEVINDKIESIAHIADLNDGIETLGFKQDTVLLLNERGIYTRKDMYEFIKEAGPNWFLFIIYTESKAAKIEEKLNIVWDDSYSLLDSEEFQDKVFQDIKYSSVITQRTRNMLSVVLRYYKHQHFLEFDLYYRNITGFSWSSVIDKYGKPKYQFMRRLNGFLKYVNRPEIHLLLYRGVELKEGVKNFKLYYICKSVGFDVTFVKEKYANSDTLLTLSVSTRSRNILQSFGWRTYGEARNGILSIGADWYVGHGIQKYYADEIEFVLGLV